MQSLCHVSGGKCLSVIYLVEVLHKYFTYEKCDTLLDGVEIGFLCLGLLVVAARG